MVMVALDKSPDAHAQNLPARSVEPDAGVNENVCEYDPVVPASHVATTS